MFYSYAGIKSIARDIVGGASQGEPKPTGFAAYRATVDVEKMKKIPELNWILQKPGLNVWYVVFVFCTEPVLPFLSAVSLWSICLSI